LKKVKFIVFLPMNQKNPEKSQIMVYKKYDLNYIGQKIKVKNDLLCLTDFWKDVRRSRKIGNFLISSGVSNGDIEPNP